jgi:mannonate dehydratase
MIPTMLLTPPEDRRWGIARQMGVTHTIAKLAPELTGDDPIDDRAALDRQIARYQASGLTIAGLEGDQFDMSRIKLGLPGRDEDIARYRAMLANMGAAGIRLLCYNWMPLGWLRNRFDLPARGGATVTGYRHDSDAEAACEPVIDSDTLWANYEYFLAGVIDAAEAAGVVMGLHPDDPPLSIIRGVARIFSTVAGVDRALALSNSPAHALTFCQGTYSLIEPDLPALVRRWGAAGRIAFVHVRDVRGPANDFVETFPDDGHTDMAALFAAYRAIGFGGYVRPDHAPDMLAGTATFAGGTSVGYSAEGMIFTMGFIKGLLLASATS